MTWAPGSTGGRVLRGGFGIFVGPGQTEDQIQPIESDRISTTIERRSTFRSMPTLLRANFVNNPNNRILSAARLRERYTIPERVYQYSASVQRELPRKLVATAAYVGSQGRNLFLRNFTNRIVGVQTNADPAKNAVIIREFDIVNGSSIQRPFAEVDFKTSGGHDSYNSMQLSLARRISSGLTLNSQYTLAQQLRQHGRLERSADRRQPVRLRLRHRLQRVRRAPHLQRQRALLAADRRRPPLPGQRLGLTQALLGGWDVGAIVNARSGLPIDVRVTRPDVVYVDAAGSVFREPRGRAHCDHQHAGRRLVTQRAAAEPHSGRGSVPEERLQWLNPAAFSIPAPGEFGNLQRGALRGPVVQAGGLPGHQALRHCGTANVEVRLGGLQPVQHQQLQQPCGHPAERARHRHKTGSAGTAVHTACRDVRQVDQHRGPHGGAGPEPGPVAVRLNFSVTSADTTWGGCWSQQPPFLFHENGLCRWRHRRWPVRTTCRAVWRAKLGLSAGPEFTWPGHGSRVAVTTLV